MWHQAKGASHVKIEPPRKRESKQDLFKRKATKAEYIIDGLPASKFSELLADAVY
jgi:hypothetical protein